MHTLTNTVPPLPIPVALTRCDSYHAPDLSLIIGKLLDVAGPRITAGDRVLVKPNMVSLRPLSCTTPAVVKAVCSWLLEHGARITVSDSPGIGRATHVAHAIGLDDALRPLGLTVRNMDEPRQVLLPLGNCSPTDHAKAVHVGISRLALESDLIVSVPRLKAHRFTLLTLAVKNCFGCVPGVRKALMHTFHGRGIEFFTDCLAAIWASLPPVAALIDGIEAMHVTGPIRGQGIHLGLLGASPSAAALDEAIAATLGVSIDRLPLAQALRRRNNGEQAPVNWPMCRPDDFDCSAFVLPEKLDSAWFHPLRIVKSIRARIAALWQRGESS